MGADQRDDPWIFVGRAGRAHGIKGGLSLHLENPDSQLLEPGLVLRFEPPGKLARELVVTRVYQASTVEVEGVRDRHDAEELRGAEVLVKRSALPPLDEDELYLVDWLGAEVRRDDDGRLLGVVERFSDNRAQPLAEVRTPGGELVLMPFVPGILTDLDEEARVVKAHPPDGMFEGDALEVPPEGGSEPDDEEGA